jgi:type I restriction enzyme R subunit
VNDEDQLHFAQGVADRIRRDDSLLDQMNSRSPEQVMHGLFPKRVSEMVLDAMTDDSKLSMEVQCEP